MHGCCTYPYNGGNEVDPDSTKMPKNVLHIIHTPHPDDVVEMLELPQTEESILVSIEVVKQQLRLVAVQGKLVLQHQHSIILRQAAPQVTVHVFIKDALHLGPVNQKRWRSTKLSVHHSISNVTTNDELVV